jgi:hypothetical protein
MDAIAKAPRQSFRMRGRSFVALAFCPVVPIAGWLEEIDVTLARSPGFFAGKPAVLDLSAVDLIRGRAMAGPSGNAQLGSSVERLKPSCWPSTATTDRGRNRRRLAQSSSSGVVGRQHYKDHTAKLIRSGR